MPLSAGDKLGPYEIVTSIGAGGMGEVYRARDPRMGREVAIKLSGERFSDRFSREVHAIAALNHPNICHLYDVGPDYLVMELVEGSTLEQRIKQGALPLDEALRIARQIAAALEAAHDKGIVHRDLKPANVILKPDGSVKVLDFGLAQVGPGTPPGGEQDLERSPTISMRATQAGVILGTAAYMAPEQARGEPVDKRADIWAFGVVLYEMLAGQRIYDGKTVSDVLAAVLIREPDLSRVPPEVRPLLRHCLEKDPKQRLRDVGDCELLLAGPEPAPSQTLGARRFGPIGWIAAALLLIAATIGWLRASSPGKETPGLALTVVPPAGVQLDPVGGLDSAPEISPDGSAVLYASEGRPLRTVTRLFQRDPGARLRGVLQCAVLVRGLRQRVLSGPWRRRAGQGPCAGWRSGNGDAATGAWPWRKLEWQRNDTGLWDRWNRYICWRRRGAKLKPWMCLGWQKVRFGTPSFCLPATRSCSFGCQTMAPATKSAWHRSKQARWWIQSRC